MGLWVYGKSLTFSFELRAFSFFRGLRVEG